MNVVCDKYYLICSKFDSLLYEDFLFANCKIPNANILFTISKIIFHLFIMLWKSIAILCNVIPKNMHQNSMNTFFKLILFCRIFLRDFFKKNSLEIFCKQIEVLSLSRFITKHFLFQVLKYCIISIHLLYLSTNMLLYKILSEARLNIQVSGYIFIYIEENLHLHVSVLLQM